MRITLVSPYEIIGSYGLRMVSACLKAAGFETRLIFIPLHFRERYPDALCEAVARAAAGSAFVGLSLTTNYLSQGIRLTEHLKKHLGCPIMWGGIHPTVLPEECLQYADIVAVGEAESAIVELARCVEAGEDPTRVEGFWFRRQDAVIRNPVGPLVERLDDLPFPDYEWREHLFYSGGELAPFTETSIEAMTGGRYITLSSRGCVCNCAYCCNNALNRLYGPPAGRRGRQRFRRRSPDNLIAELLWARRKMPFVREVYYDDDAFLSRPEPELLAFCRAYKEQIGLPLVVTGITPMTLTEAKLELLLDAGLKWLRLGIQSGSRRVNEQLYKRAVPMESVHQALGIIRKYRRRMEPVIYDFILDNPWETQEEVVETLRLVLELPRPFRLNLFSLTFYPGTELHQKAVEEGLIRDPFADICDKPLHAIRDTYLNRLFTFFSLSRLPSPVLNMFIHPWVMKTGLNRPLWGTYAALRDMRGACSTPFRRSPP